MTTQSKSLRNATKVATDKYSWPGGHPLYAICNDGGILCPDCCNTEREYIGLTTGRDGWNCISIGVHFDYGEIIVCDHCGKEIK